MVVIGYLTLEDMSGDDGGCHCRLGKVMNLVDLISKL